MAIEEPYGKIEFLNIISGLSIETLPIWKVDTVCFQDESGADLYCTNDFSIYYGSGGCTLLVGDHPNTPLDPAGVELYDTRTETRKLMHADYPHGGQHQEPPGYSKGKTLVKIYFTQESW